VQNGNGPDGAVHGRVRQGRTDNARRVIKHILIFCFLLIDSSIVTRSHNDMVIVHIDTAISCSSSTSTMSFCDLVDRMTTSYFATLASNDRQSLACGGHARPYHFHTDLACNYDSTATGHSTLTGMLLDGRPLYGKYETTATRPTDLDACGGHTGPVPVEPRRNYSQRPSTHFPAGTFVSDV
jgi:hypothetical protein